MDKKEFREKLILKLSQGAGSALGNSTSSFIAKRVLQTADEIVARMSDNFVPLHRRTPYSLADIQKSLSQKRGGNLDIVVRVKPDEYYNKNEEDQAAILIDRALPPEVDMDDISYRVIHACEEYLYVELSGKIVFLDK